jgi:protease I
MKAVILTYTGFQDHELVYPYYRLLGAGFHVDVVADKKDELGRIYGIFGLNMPCHILLSDFVKDQEKFMNEYDLLVLPGGVKSLEKLRQNKDVLEFIAQWNKLGKCISSTCHGAQLLISAKIVKGRRISGYYSLKDDIENAGAEYVNAPFVVDANIITSPHYDHMGPWMEKTLEVYRMISVTQSSEKPSM